MTFIKFISVSDHSHYMPFDMSRAKIHNKCDLWRYKDKKILFYYAKNIFFLGGNKKQHHNKEMNEKYLA